MYFQTSTGRMPAARQDAQAERKPAVLTPEEIDAVGAFIQANGGGPELPRGARRRRCVGEDPARGGELFRLNCASCHNFTGRGGALSSGKYAPALDGVTEEQIYAAMLTGPQNMPKFSDRQLSPEEKKDIIAYVKSVTDGNNNPVVTRSAGSARSPRARSRSSWGSPRCSASRLWIGAKA